MRRFYGVWAVLVLSVCLMAAVLAQAPAAKPAAGPALTEDDRLIVQAIATVATLANADCQGLDSVKRYQQQLSQVNTRMETKYPGFRIDWGSGTLIAKPAASAK